MSHKIDEAILTELRRDCRVTVAHLAKLVGRSRTAVRARIAKLENQGHILRYTIEEPDRAREGGVGAIVMVAVTDYRQSAQLISLLHSMPEVLSCFGVAGEYDFALLMARIDNASLQRILERILKLEIVSKTTTSLALYQEF